LGGEITEDKLAMLFRSNAFTIKRKETCFFELEPDAAVCMVYDKNSHVYIRYDGEKFITNVVEPRGFNYEVIEATNERTRDGNETG